MAIAAEQIDGSPAECGGLLGPTGIEESAAIVDENLPARQWYVAGRSVGVQPGKALRPGAGDAAVVLDDRRALLLASDTPVVIPRRVSTFSSFSGGTRGTLKFRFGARRV